MTIVADENIDHKIIQTLINDGFDVYSVYFSSRGISDLQITKLPLHTSKVILTEDKDFGDMVFNQNTSDLSVILLRYPYYEVEMILIKLIQFLKSPADKILNHFTTISLHKTRSRKIYLRTKSKLFHAQ